MQETENCPQCGQKGQCVLHDVLSGMGWTIHLYQCDRCQTVYAVNG